MRTEPRHVVALAGGLAAAVGLVAPDYMCMLWPRDPRRHLRLMEAWSLSTLGLTAVLMGVRPERAVVAVCAASVPWDLAWGGAMGKVAALLNVGCVYLLCTTTPCTTSTAPLS
jgi:hypothetical protein